MFKSATSLLLLLGKKINLLFLSVNNKKVEAIDAHGLKIQGRGYGMFLPKFLGGVKGFRKNCQGGYTYFAFFYCIFINKFLEN